MAEKLSLQLEPRTMSGKAVKKLRREGVVPVAVCGKGVVPYSAQVNERDLTNLVRKAGATSLVEIALEGKKQQAFVQELQRHPVTRRVLHVDFHVVDLKVEMTVDVPIVAVGENKLVERGDAILNLALHSLYVRCLPTDVPHQIDVDISVLADFHSSIHVGDLQLGSKVQVLTPAEEVVASLVSARMAVEEEPEVEAVAEPELVRGERKDDEE